MKPVKSQKPARNRGKWGAGSGSVIDWETNSIMTYRERLYCWAFAKRAVGIRSSEEKNSDRAASGVHIALCLILGLS